MQTNRNSPTPGPDSASGPVTEGHSRFNQDIPPLGVDTSGSVNKKGLVFLGMIGLIGMAAAFWMFSGGAKRQTAEVKAKQQEAVAIPAPPRQYPEDKQMLATARTNSSAGLASGGATAIPLASDAQSVGGSNGGARGANSVAGANSAGGGTAPYDPKNPSLDQRRAMDALLIQPFQVTEKVKGGDQAAPVDDPNTLVRRRTTDGGRVSYTANTAATAGAMESSAGAAESTSTGDPIKDARALLANVVAGKGVPGFGGAGGGGGLGGQGGGRSAANVSPDDGDVGGPNTLPATAFPVQAARKIPSNADFSILQGTAIRCLMNTRLISDIPGQVMCTVTENILSTSARKILIPKGTKVIGEYGGQANPSLERVGIIWNRLITPANIDIALGSPGTDPLGSTGVPGYVDEKWRMRLGAASLITLTSDIIKIALQKNAPTTTTQSIDQTTGRVTTTEVPFDSATVKLIARAPDPFLARVLNMPATIIIQQGTMVAIQTAKDMDFSNVYENQ